MLKRRVKLARRRRRGHHCQCVVSTEPDVVRAFIGCTHPIIVTPHELVMQSDFTCAPKTHVVSSLFLVAVQLLRLSSAESHIMPTGSFDCCLRIRAGVSAEADVVPSAASVAAKAYVMTARTARRDELDIVFLVAVVIVVEVLIDVDRRATKPHVVLGPFLSPSPTTQPEPRLKHKTVSVAYISGQNSQ